MSRKIKDDASILCNSEFRAQALVRQRSVIYEVIYEVIHILNYRLMNDKRYDLSYEAV